MQEESSLVPEYVVGLVDGEGSFTFHLNTNPNRRNRMEPRFFLKLRAEDKRLLENLRNFFECGKVYIQRDQRPKHSLCYRFEVGNKNDLQKKVIPFFKKYPLRSPSKSRDFTAFCKAMKIFDKRKHFTEEGMTQLSSLKKQMH
jgi:hypothetical protein